MKHRWSMNALSHWHGECRKCGAAIRLADEHGGPRGGMSYDIRNPDGSIVHNLTAKELAMWKGQTACQEVKR